MKGSTVTRYRKLETRPGESVPARHWLALIGSMLGAFMAVLDIQITNASLKDILGSLGSTLDEGSWVSTSYLVAEIVVIPLTAWLSEVFSTRRYLLANAALFLFFSVCCAWSWSLPSLIVFRALQGFTGGVLIPTAFNLVLKLLPPARRRIGFALFGMTATFAPAIGPTIGGWLTDNYGWGSIFYINLVPGLALIAAVAWGLQPERPKMALLGLGDWRGIATMALGLGCLIILLEEGNRNDWFSSGFMVTMACVATVSLVSCVIIELTQPHPFVNLRLLTRRNFWLGSLIGMAFGAGMYGATYLLPLYLVQVQGYNAQQIGQTIMWSGLPQILMMPLAAFLLSRVDARILLTVGLVLFSGSSLMNSTISSLSGYDQIILSQIVRAVGMPLVIVPITVLATGLIEPANSASASALFNMFRNLGGSIGIALLETHLDLREKLHSVRLSESVSAFSSTTTDRLGTLAHYFVSQGSDLVTAAQQALEGVNNTLCREAFVMAYGDCFFLLGTLLFSCVVLVWFCRPAGSQAFASH